MQERQDKESKERIQSDEEFAEKLYDREATSDKFDEPHSVSATGSELRPPTVRDSGEREELEKTDSPPPESSDTQQ